VGPITTVEWDEALEAVEKKWPGSSRYGSIASWHWRHEHWVVAEMVPKSDRGDDHRWTLQIADEAIQWDI
jgi:hypothetical protein